MSIFSNIFNSQAQAPQQPAPAQQPPEQVQPGNIQDPATIAAQSTVANEPPPAPAQKEGNSPLAQFEGLWQNAPNDGTETPQQPTVQQLDPKAVQAAVSKLNFSESIAPEQLAAITAGGEDAQAAFAQVMNQVAQQAVVQSTLVNSKLAEQNTQKLIEAQLAKMPDALRQQASTDHLKTTNPLFNNPAVKPVMEATQQQLLQKYPNATHAEITQMTQDYIVAMGESIAPAPAVDPSAPKEQDWGSFLNM